MPFTMKENGKNPKAPFIIGVSGGTSSGKTSVCQNILKILKEYLELDDDCVAIISQDNFYKDLTVAEIDLANNCQYNFDHPDAFDTVLMKQTLIDLSSNKTVRVPEYDFKTHRRQKDEYIELQNCKVVLFEGILTFYHKDVRDMFDMKLFVDSDADTRLSRRVLRDISDRGRELESILHQYTTFVKPAFEEFCLPNDLELILQAFWVTEEIAKILDHYVKYIAATTFWKNVSKKYADVIIPRGAENSVAINLIVQHIRDILTGGLHTHSQNGHMDTAIHRNGKSHIHIIT